jgi:di/tricarboxylate transporter
MTISQIFVLILLFVPLTLVFMNKLREDVAALLMAASLGIAQFLGMGVLAEANHPEAASKALEGFGSPEVITLMALFILTYSLDKYGITRWLAGRLVSIGGKSESRLIGLFALSGAILSLFMNTLAAGALLLPSALEASRRTGVKPSKLLIPIAYGTMLGGAATYLTTANIIISGLLPLANPPQEPLGFFDFTPTGGIVAIVGLLFLAFFGKYLLPDYESSSLAPIGDDLSAIYHLDERLWQALVPKESPLIGAELKSAISPEAGLTVLGIRRGTKLIPSYQADFHLAADDILFLVGQEARVLALQHLQSSPYHEASRLPDLPNTLLAEVIVPPRSKAEGKTLRDLSFRANYGFTAVALGRNNELHRTDVSKMPLEIGDSLLLLGAKEGMADLQKQHDFVLLRADSESSRLEMRPVALTLAISLGGLAATMLGFPVALAMLCSASLLLLTGLIQPEEAYGAIKWRAIFLIAGTIALSAAMVETNLAQAFGGFIVQTVEPYGAMGLVVGAYLLSAILTQLMGGQISPLVVGPITISAAIHLGVNPQAIAVVTAIAGSVSFITPLSHPVNILMIAPANYRFRDFVKSGWILTILCFLALLVAVPLVWDL